MMYKMDKNRSEKLQIKRDKKSLTQLVKRDKNCKVQVQTLSTIKKKKKERKRSGRWRSKF